MRILLIALMILFLGGVHILSQSMDFGSHMVHQQLFFIPLVLTSFWFGLKTGIFAAGLISLLYGPPLYLHQHEPGLHFLILSQILLYFLVAGLMGYLADRRKKQEKALIESEKLTTLAKTASALSFEIDDIAKSIGNIHTKGKGFQEPVANEFFLAELDRLHQMIAALKRFVPSFSSMSLSSDLNKIVRQTQHRYSKEAKDRGVKLQVETDQSGCPTLLSLEKLSQVYEALVHNAILFSTKGDTVRLVSKRSSDFCELSVIDQGPGVSRQNEAKLFTPFFTTRKDGYGLSLSSGKKLLNELGGDLQYRPAESGGACFTMIIPREGRSENLENYVDDVLSSPSRT